jgi:hypothetical protein
MTRYVSLHKFALKYFPHGAISSPFGGCAARSGAFTAGCIDTDPPT